jgi:hypothetical protein
MRKLLTYVDDLRFRRYLPYQLPSGNARAYFYHIRKTGGQSILQALLAACDPEKRDPFELMGRLWAARRHRMLLGGKLFVAGEKKLIEKGEYFYAQSHMAMHEFQVPRNTLTATFLRDPVERVISHYKSLRVAREKNNNLMKKEGHWLGNDFSQFLEKIPREHLQRQLYTFSAAFDRDEAMRNLGKIDLVLFNDRRSDGLATFSRMIGIEIRNIHAHRTEDSFVPNPEEVELLESRMASEIDFYRAARVPR